MYHCTLFQVGMGSEKHPSSSIIKFVLTLIGLLLSFLRGQLYSLCPAPQKVSGTKYLLYICRVQSCVWRLPKYWPPIPLSTQRVCPPPHQRRGGTPRGGTQYTLAGRWGGAGGSIFWKTPHIGLASYSIISLRWVVYLHRCAPQLFFCLCAMLPESFLKGQCHEIDIFLKVWTF